MRGKAIGGPAPGTVEHVVEEDAGFEEGFEALYRREYERLVRAAFLLLDAESLAEEAVHDAFAEVHERWTKIDDHGAFLRRCVVNRCRALQRRSKLERRQRLEGAAYDELGARELTDALGALPHDQRAAIVLRYYGGLSEAGIAAALDVAPGTVTSSLSRGLAELREVVER